MEFENRALVLPTSGYSPAGALSTASGASSFFAVLVLACAPGVAHWEPGGDQTGPVREEHGPKSSDASTSGSYPPTTLSSPQQSPMTTAQRKIVWPVNR
jgi:hypothetical protein